MLSLSWNNHSSTFAHTLASVREKERYSDVTLSCDGNFYPVHKLVLASCSDYFQRLFEQTPCKHPVIVLQDVRSQEMEALLNYMYAGVISVAQSDLPKLIKVAESLQLKGLAVPDENLCNNMKYGHTWSPTSDSNSPYPKKHLKEDSGTQTQGSQMTKIIQPRTSVNSQSNQRYGQQGYNTIGSSVGNSVPHRFSPYHRDSPTKVIHRSDNRKEHIIIPRVTPKMECKNEGKLYGHYHARPDTTTDRHDHRIGRTHGYGEKHSGHTSDEGMEKGMDTEDENSSEMQEMLPVSLVKVEVKEEEEEETAVDLGDGVGRECSPPLAPPQDQPLPLLHPRLPTPPHERHPGAPGVEGAALNRLTLKEEFEEFHEEVVSESESELSSLVGNRDSKELNRGEDARLTLQAFLGRGQGTTGVTIKFEPHSSILKPGSSEAKETDQPICVGDCSGSSKNKSTPHHSSQIRAQSVEPHYHADTKRNVNKIDCSQIEAAAVAQATMDQKTLQCPLCPYISTRHYVLVRHMRTHTGERPYACPHCHYRGTDKGNLNVHIRSHTGIKPFLCPHCPARFSQNVHLKDHLRTHSGEKPYACPRCTYRSCKSSDLNRHMKLYCIRRHEGTVGDEAPIQ